MSEIMQYLSLCAWFISLNIMSHGELFLSTGHCVFNTLLMVGTHWIKFSHSSFLYARDQQNHSWGVQSGSLHVLDNLSASMVLYFKMVGRKSKEEKYFVTHENYMRFKFRCPYIQFYWHTAVLICLHRAYGCFHITITGLSCCHIWPPKLKIFSIWPLPEKVFWPSPLYLRISLAYLCVCTTSR